MPLSVEDARRLIQSNLARFQSGLSLGNQAMTALNAGVASAAARIEGRAGDGTAGNPTIRLETGSQVPWLSKMSFLNGTFTGTAMNTRSWVWLEVPESQGAAKVTCVWARLIVTPEWKGIAETDIYAGMCCGRVEPDASWYLGNTMPSFFVTRIKTCDDGAGRSILNTFGTEKPAYPVVVQRDDIDGKYYITIVVDSNNHGSVLPSCVYGIRCLVFRDEADPVIQAVKRRSIANASPMTLGAAPVAGISYRESPVEVMSPHAASANVAALVTQRYEEALAANPAVAAVVAPAMDRLKEQASQLAVTQAQATVVKPLDAASVVVAGLNNLAKGIFPTSSAPAASTTPTGTAATTLELFKKLFGI